MDVIHPAARVLVDISRSQDAEVGDGTTSVALLASELLKESKNFVEEGVSTHTLVRGFKLAARLAVEKVRSIAVEVKKSDPR